MPDTSTMLMIVVFALGVALVPLTGGRLGNIGRRPLRAGWLMGVSLGLQLLVTTVIEVPESIGGVVHLVSYAPLVVFFVLNVRRAGLAVVFLGAALNLAAILSNGGTMPASASAVERAGLELGDGFENSAPVDGANLAFLGDVFAVPASVPFANVFSVGDVLIVAGGLWFVHAGSRRRDGDATDDVVPASADQALSSVSS